MVQDGETVIYGFDALSMIEKFNMDSSQPCSPVPGNIPIYSVALLETTIINELVAFEALINLTPM